MNKTLKTVLILAGAGLILFLLYAFFLQPAPASTDAVTGGLISVSTTDSADPSSADIVSLLGQMQRIQLDRTLFAGQLYQSLHDFGVTISPEPYGKDDPFASLDGSSAAASASLTLPSAPAAPAAPVRRAAPPKQAGQ